MVTSEHDFIKNPTCCTRLLIVIRSSDTEILLANHFVQYGKCAFNSRTNNVIPEHSSCWKPIPPIVTIWRFCLNPQRKPFEKNAGSKTGTWATRVWMNVTVGRCSKKIRIKNPDSDTRFHSDGIWELLINPQLRPSEQDGRCQFRA